MMAEMPETMVFEMRRPFLQRMFRTMLFLVCVAISYAALKELGLVMAITGSLCTVLVGIACPAMFYFAIFRNYTSYLERVTLIVIAALIVMCGVFLLFNQMHSFLL